MARGAVKLLLVAVGYIAVTASTCCEELPVEEQEACFDFFDSFGFPIISEANDDTQPQLAGVVPSEGAQSELANSKPDRGGSCS